MGNNCCSYEGDQMESSYGVEGTIKRRGAGSTALLLKKRALQDYGEMTAKLTRRQEVFEDHEFPAELETI